MVGHSWFRLSLIYPTSKIRFGELKALCLYNTRRVEEVLESWFIRDLGAGKGSQKLHADLHEKNDGWIPKSGAGLPMLRYKAVLSRMYDSHWPMP